jgi:hypothetical protein
VVLSGATTAQTTIGDEAGFAGEGVVVGVRVADDDAAAPAVAWVWRDEAGAARTTPRFLRRVSQGTALLSGDSVVVIADDGALVRRTALPGLEELVGLNVVIVDDDVHVIGAVGASVNEAWTRSRWLVVDSAGALTADREIDGTVLAAQAGPAPATPGIVVAFGLTANQPWDGGFVLQTALAGAKLLTNGAVQARGAPVTLPPEVGSGTATIVSLAGAPSTTRRDGSLDVALTFFTGATTLARVDDDGLALVAGYGNPTTNVTARFEVRAEGLATLGDSLVLGARVTGTVPFNNASITHTGPVLFELP